jgi:hypothetical protein
MVRHSLNCKREISVPSQTHALNCCHAVLTAIVLDPDHIVAPQQFQVPQSVL